MSYAFVKSPKHWDDSCHRRPCEETRRIDKWLNSIAEIRLSPDDMRQAKQYAAEEHRASRGFTELKVSKESGLRVTELGYFGQCAFARWAGVCFAPTTGSYRNADFPQFNVEVRTRTKGWHDLKVRGGNYGDDDSRRMVLAIYFGDQWPVRLCGWILAKEGKKFEVKDWGGAGKPVHQVPQEALASMTNLSEVLRITPKF